MKKYILLDIDRTIINGTSWYYACTCPDLLISSRNIERFKWLNDNLFMKGSENDKIEFRKRTFALMNRKISEKCYNMLLESGCASGLSPNKYVDEVFFECAGMYTLKNLIVEDEYCKKLLKLIYRYYWGDVEIIFLTSGYEPFMKGLISIYMRNFEEEYKWTIVGSEIEFYKGKINIKNIISQRRKYQFVDSLLQKGERVVFLADDSDEDSNLFDVVIQNKGYAFNVKYDGITHKLNWKELYEKISDQDEFLNYMMNRSEVSIADTKIANDSFYHDHSNQIGILRLSHNEYTDFINHITDKNVRAYVEKMVYQNEEWCYLRGMLYYYWLPPYITVSLENKYEGWLKLFIHGFELLGYLTSHFLKKNKYIDLIIYMVCDHLLAALYLAIYCLEKEILSCKAVDMTNYKYINNSICIIHKIMISNFDNSLDYSQLSILHNNLDLISLEELRIINENKKFILELDNYQTVYRTVQNITENLGNKIHSINQLIYFAHGGIALGYAFQATLKVKYNKEVTLFPCYFSSKCNTSVNEILNRIPNLVNNQDVWKDESNILLLDNNVTTFKTLSAAKSYLHGRNNNVLCAVAGVDYQNIYNWLFEKSKYETMCCNWFEVVDIKPTEAYISAYNTWGTSKKSEILEQIYLRNEIDWEVDNIVPRNICSQHRKICRVHNIYDLQIALEMGATMIGVHAVISNKNNYYTKEYFDGNKGKNYPDLPVPDFEISGIRYMVEHLPSNIIPVLVIENELPLVDIDQILKLYGLDVKKCGLQIQFKVDDVFIHNVKSMGFAHIIIAVGIMQSDIKNYITQINKQLNESTDFLLIDMSKHQPQILTKNTDATKYTLDFATKFNTLQNMIEDLLKLDVSLLLADDISPDELILCQLMLVSHGVKIAGLDMQNNIEVNKEEQGYCKIKEKESNNYHYAKIRKSIDKINIWKAFEPSFIMYL